MRGKALNKNMENTVLKVKIKNNYIVMLLFSWFNYIV